MRLFRYIVARSKETYLGVAADKALIQSHRKRQGIIDWAEGQIRCRASKKEINILDFFDKQGPFLPAMRSKVEEVLGGIAVPEGHNATLTAGS